MARSSRRARPHDLHEVARALPHVTVWGDGTRPVYQVGGKSFLFFRTARPDAVDPETGQRYDDVVVAVPLGDALVGQVDLGVVLRQVAGEVRGLVLEQRAAVLAQVEGVEVVAARDPELRGGGLEEVVAEPVQVQHRPP